MGYNKFIKYGNNVEILEYEKDIFVLRGGRHHVSHDKKPRVDPDSDVTEIELGKRQDNARRASQDFGRLVSSNLDDKTPPPLLATITYKENVTSLSEAYRHHRSFEQSLRYRYGKEFKYIGVPEFQTRGAVHFHVLFWGLPADTLIPECSKRIYDEHVSPTLTSIWGKGLVFLKETDGNDKLSTYLAKYMAKAFTDPRLKHMKAYVSSHNCLRPYTVSDINPLWVLLDNYLGDNPVPVIDQTYHTKWLGTCHRRLFKMP